MADEDEVVEADVVLVNAEVEEILEAVVVPVLLPISLAE